MVHSTCRAPARNAASELATAKPRSLWQCTDTMALSILGTRFINTTESGAEDGYRQMIIDTCATDIFFGTITDAPSNTLIPSLVRAGVTVGDLRKQDPQALLVLQERKKRWKDVWSAGHGVGAIHDVLSVADLADRLKTEYNAAKDDLKRLQAVA